MAKKRKKKNETAGQEMNAGKDSLRRFAEDFLILRNAIIQNCRDCIRDCGRDCLDSDARPIENIRCPLQKVRIDYGIAITHDDHDFTGWRQPEGDGIGLK